MTQNTFTTKLRHRWQHADSMLCIGLDPDPRRIPAHLGAGHVALGRFCREIIAATADLACAFKPQIAYFAALGAETLLAELIEEIHEQYPDIPVILDAKRGDIGSTAQQYGIEAFDRFKADALTLSPFMGFDSIEPYFQWEGRGLILLCRTSNPGGNDLQALRLQPLPDRQGLLPATAPGKGPGESELPMNGGMMTAALNADTDDTHASTRPRQDTGFISSGGRLQTADPGRSKPAAKAQSDSPLLYEHIARLAAGSWNRSGELGLVVGATFPAELARVRQLAPTLPLLVPGVGAQGGDVDATVRAGLDADGHGLIINSSRAILYASEGPSFAQAARQAATDTRDAIRRAKALALASQG
ncbi:MAG: orotidine-5'-phosphate decarboxylase [Lautropia sp.]|nr:orotidine-5'-phosphate decarboxylase [Lautropia sp.]